MRALDDFSELLQRGHDRIAQLVELEFNTQLSCRTTRFGLDQQLKNVLHHLGESTLAFQNLNQKLLDTHTGKGRCGICSQPSFQRTLPGMALTALTAVFLRCPRRDPLVHLSIEVRAQRLQKVQPKEPLAL